MPAAGVVLMIAVLLIVVALVFYLVSTIVALQKITKGLDEAIAGVVGIIEKSEPVNEVVGTINANLDAGVDLLEGLLVKKAGMEDAVGLVDGLYPGAAAEGFRNFPDSKTTKAPRISEVYTSGTLTLARLGREAPIAAASPNGPALRNPAYGSLAARRCTPRSDSSGRRTCRARRSSAPIRRCSTSPASPPVFASGCARQRRQRGEVVQTPAPFEYERATSVEGAIASLVKHGPEARLIAGGHSLLPMMKLRLANPEYLIDINDLTELSYIDGSATRSGSGR